MNKPSLIKYVIRLFFCELLLKHLGLPLVGSRHSTSENGSLIEFEAAKTEDGGVFVCRAENPFGFKTASARLRVTERGESSSA